MGYWATQTGNIGGDEPSDIMSDAIDAIRACFMRDLDCEPTRGDLRGVLESVIQSFGLEE